MEEILPKPVSLSQLPPTVKYIVGQEFCERFSYYGMRAVLALYLNTQLKMSEDSATESVHLFIVAAYLTPLMGALLSDSYIGKYRTIMYLSIVYCIGNWTLAISAIDMPISSARLVAFLGLALISIGTGGIKPCVCAFGGDQIELGLPPSPFRDHLLRLFFSAFYFSINVGSTFSTVITPWVRTHFESYSLAFSLPAILLVSATFVFWAGSKDYVHQEPSGNLLSEVLGIVFHAAWLNQRGASVEVSQKLLVDSEGTEEPKPLTRRGTPSDGRVAPPHWLDVAKGRYGDGAVEDVKLLLQVLLLFIPVPIFWSLYDQQASRWVFQAQKMDGRFLWFTIEPDQMQTANSVLILIMIPLFDQIIYPFLERRGISLRPIRRMTAGMLLGAIAFVVSGLLQIWMDTVALTSTASGNCGDPGVNCIPIMWQMPQYVIVTAAEILFSITGLELAYSQAPTTMTAVVNSFWLLTVAFGNLFTVLVVGTVGQFLTKSQEFFFFSFGCLLAMWLLQYVGKGFTYVPNATIPGPPLESQSNDV